MVASLHRLVAVASQWPQCRRGVALADELDWLAAAAVVRTTGTACLNEIYRAKRSAKLA